jgi:hypothetical protein
MGLSEEDDMSLTHAARVGIVSAACLLAAALSAGQTIGPVAGSEVMVGVSGLPVPPVKRSEIANMVDAGTIDTEGYTHVTVNLAGELKGTASQQGVVAAVLIPDIEPFETAYRTLGLLPASLDLTAAVAAHGSAYFMAKQETLEVGFPRYRVLLYNTSGSTATVAFFAYRSRR